jgi:hypothetical protein
MSDEGGVWTWHLVNAQGGPVSLDEDDGDATPASASRFEAERWLGEHWRSLVDAGATRALLSHGSQAVGAGVELGRS